MAFTNFYLIAGGAGSADINAGSSIGAARVTTTNGNWDSTTGIFLAASGTPFASTIVGDYASVYIDAATVAVFVGKVTTVTSNISITVDVTSIKYGTAPSTSTTGRSCTINGSWNTEQVLAAGGLGTTTVPQSTKINFKGNLTLTASRTISMAGATTTPLWFSGYNTTPADLDADTTNSLAKPVWTLNATFQLVTSGVYQMWSGLSLVGNRLGTIWSWTGTGGQMIRCRVDNTSSNAAAIAYTPPAQQHAYCWYRTPTTATSTGTISWTTASPFFHGCVFEGGGLSGATGTTGAPVFLNCIFLNNTGAGIQGSTAQMRVLFCTFYTPSVDGIKWTGTPAAGVTAVIGCLFATATNGINNASGTNTSNIFRACNDYFAVTNAEVGLGDHPAFFGQTDAASPVTSATDMTPVAGSAARDNGFPGIFENGGALVSNVSYKDIGAVEASGVVAVTVSNVAVFQPRQTGVY